MPKFKEINDANAREFTNKNSEGEYLNISGKNTYALIAEKEDYSGKKSSVVICECREIDLWEEEKK